MIEINQFKEIGEFFINAISLIILTIVGSYAIIKYLQMNREVKQAIIEERKANVQRLLSRTNKQ